MYAGEGEDNSKVIVTFKPQLMLHPDLYMKTDKPSVTVFQTWSSRWDEFCTLRILQEIGINGSNLDKLKTLTLSGVQEIIKNKSIVKMCPPAYIPLAYVARVFMSERAFAGLKEGTRENALRHMEILHSDSYVTDAYMAMSRAYSSEPFKKEQRYTFGLDPFLGNYATRLASQKCSYRFTCGQKKIDLTFAFYDDTVNRKQKININWNGLSVEKPECGIEYVIRVQGEKITIEGWELLDENAPNDKHLCLTESITLGFDPVFFTMNTNETHASVNNNNNIFC